MIPVAKPARVVPARCGKAFVARIGATYQQDRHPGEHQEWHR